MTINVDNNGTIYIHQGDSGQLIIDGLSTDKDYRVYFAVKDKNRKPVGSELVVNSNYKTSVTFILSGEFTDLFVVPADENYAIYYYAMKICCDGEENTLAVDGSEFGKMNLIIVYPKMVEGD